MASKLKKYPKTVSPSSSQKHHAKSTKSLDSSAKTTASRSSDKSSKKDVSTRGGGEVPINAVKVEHDQVMKEEKTQRWWLCGTVIVCIIVCFALMAVMLVDRYGKKPSTPAEYEIGFGRENGSYAGDTDDAAGLGRQPMPREPRLPNLTELCMKTVKPNGCFFHKNYYPTDCSKTTCDSVIVNLNPDALPWRWVYTKETQPISVPERTPCGDGKLCISGQCVEHADAASFIKPEPQKGGVKVNCNQQESSCIIIKNKTIDEKRYTTCYKCDQTPWNPKFFKDAVAVRFLSCNNPMPVNHTPGCFLMHNDPPNPKVVNFFWRGVQAESVPLVMYDFCQTCTTPKEIDMVSCAMRGGKLENTTLPFALPCKSIGAEKYEPTFCMSDGACMPLYKAAPELYNFRPIQKCP